MLVCFVVLSLGPSGCSTPPVKVSDVALTYTNYHKITAEPVYMDPALAMLCTPIPSAHLAKKRLEHGPHALAALTIYMNDLAALNFTNRNHPYPVASVIVKEKRVSPHFADDKNTSFISEHGVGGMIKRAPGYDPANGDWEYFYFEQPEKIESGRIATCVKCHAYARTTDFVYGTWRKR